MPKGIGQLALCSLKIHFMEPFLWTAKIPVLAGGLGVLEISPPQSQT